MPGTKNEKENIMLHKFNLYLTKPVELFHLSKILKEILSCREEIQMQGINEFEIKHLQKQKEKIRMLALDLKYESEQEEWDKFEEKMVAFMECTKDTKYENLHIKSFHILMDVRKNKTLKIAEAMEDLLHELEHSIIQ